MTGCKHVELPTGEAFRTDAKAEGNDVAIGGWQTSITTDPMKAKWFAIVLNEENTPWLRARGEPFQVIASLELLATLFAVMAFWPEGKAEGYEVRLTGTGLTDNRGNAYVVSRMLTTKFPLCAILMELAEQLERRGSWLKQAWCPREQNIEADALTNGDYHQFHPDNRIILDPRTIKWVILDVMLEAGGSMESELLRLRQEKKAIREKAKDVKKKLRKEKLAAETPRQKDPWWSWAEAASSRLGRAGGNTCEGCTITSKREKEH